MKNLEEFTSDTRTEDGDRKFVVYLMHLTFNI
jgi:hypothetical protein